MEDKFCAGRVWDGFRNYPCSRRPSISEDGKEWCHQHAPSRVRARRDKSSENYRLKLKPDILKIHLIDAVLKHPGPHPFMDLANELRAAMEALK